MTDSKILAEIRPTTVRRFLGWGMLLALGVLLIMIAITQPPALGWQIFLVLFGALMIYLAERLRRATSEALLLTADAVVTTNGEVVAQLANIVKVERGVFAFKPSNGFVLALSNPGSPRWEPGLWWRYGRRVGVGGVVSAPASKFMAEQIALKINSKE